MIFSLASLDDWFVDQFDTLLLPSSVPPELSGGQISPDEAHDPDLAELGLIDLQEMEELDALAKERIENPDFDTEDDAGSVYVTYTEKFNITKLD